MKNNNYYTHEQMDLFGEVYICCKIRDSFDNFMKNPWGILEQIGKESAPTSIWNGCEPLLPEQFKIKNTLEAEWAREKKQKECKEQKAYKAVQLTLGFPDEY